MAADLYAMRTSIQLRPSVFVPLIEACAREFYEAETLSKPCGSRKELMRSTGVRPKWESCVVALRKKELFVGTFCLLSLLKAVSSSLGFGSVDGGTPNFRSLRR